MVNYVELYRIDLGDGATEIGIEDLSRPGCPSSRHEPSDQYLVWAGGCGIGRTKTLDEAHKRIADYVADRAQTRVAEAQAVQERAQRTLGRLEGSAKNLWKFRVEQEREIEPDD